MNITEAEQALLAHDQHDRAADIRLGLKSLETDEAGPDQAEVEAAWRTELRNRVLDIENDNVDLLGVAESHAQLREELAAHRKWNGNGASIPRRQW